MLGRLYYEAPDGGDTAGEYDADAFDLEDTGWDLGAAAAGTSDAPAGRSRGPATAAVADEEEGSPDIEVLLPEADDDVEYPSDADSEDFVQWMQAICAEISPRYAPRWAPRSRPVSSQARTTQGGAPSSGGGAKPAKPTKPAKASAKPQPAKSIVKSNSCSGQTQKTSSGGEGGGAEARRGGGRSARRRSSQRRRMGHEGQDS